MGQSAGGHAFDGLAGRAHLGQCLLGVFAAADPDPVDLVPSRQAGDLQVATAREAVDGLGSPAERERQLRHLHQGLRIDGGGEIVPGLRRSGRGGRLAAFTQALAHAQSHCVDVLHGCSDFEAGDVVADLDPIPGRLRELLRPDLYAIGFTHARFQEIAWEWAESQGATLMRATKVVDFASTGGATATIVHDGVERQVRARLLVGADGKHSKARQWTGGESRSDLEIYRFGGVAVRGLETEDRDTNNGAGAVGCWANWFGQGIETTRIYLCMDGHKLHETGVHRSFEALTRFAGRYMPPGAVENVTQAGPIGFFPNSDTWATRVSGDHVTLVGDAAGSVDPGGGHGTSLAMRDVRELSGLLLSEDDWSTAVREYEDRRRGYYDVIHHVDQWNAAVNFDASPEGDRLRAGRSRAEAVDATLGGFGVLAAHGPDGLVADDKARAGYFGESLS